MEYTIVNGASAIARGATKYFAKNASKIKLLDTKVYRQGVYRLQEELEGTNFEKHQTASSKSLEFALEGSETVVYFTHDYLSMSHPKGKILEATAKAAKNVGVSKLIWVCPIEYDMYYTEGDLSPIDIKNESEENARKVFPEMVLLHPNLVFGDYSYLMRYVTQSILAGKIHKSLADPSDNTSYFPIHLGDVAEVVNHAIENHNQVKGNTFIVKGKHDITLSELKNLIERQFDTKKVAFTNNFGVGDFIGEFFRGLGHDQNMCMMADFFKSNYWEFTHENDYHKKFDLAYSHHIHEFTKEQEITEEKFMYPLFSGYKSPELD